MPMTCPSLPYHENPTPTSYDSMTSTQPESFSHIAMASLMHAMSTLDTEPNVDSPNAISPTHSERAEPPPLPTKWGLPKSSCVPCAPGPKVEEKKNLSESFAHVSRDDDTQNAKQEVFKATPQRVRPNRPLSPL